MMNEAVLMYEQALILQPDNPKRLAELVHYIYHACAWDKIGGHERRLLDMVRQRREGISPFALLGMNSTAQEQLICAESFSHYNPVPFTHSSRSPNDKIKIGYLSCDLHNHATAHLMVELFERHDRSRFNITAYSYGPDDGSVVRDRVVKSFDNFIEVGELSDKAAAQKIYDENIDILVDLKGGYTTGARIGIPALRPAPIQVNYLGYPGTMGVNFIDYIIADKFIIPEDQQRFYSEKVVYLPDCYQPNDTQRQIADVVPMRKDCHLPEHGFVFCCFNATYKITPLVFGVWMRLLQKVPDSVLWLLEANQSVKGNLQHEAEKRGVDPKRIIFAPKISPPQHLARHSLADLFLDTLPVNAHTTASDAIWAGLPLLTCVGSTFAGRVAGSLLKAANLPELIAYSLENYEAIALNLAQNKSLLAGLREKIKQTRLQMPLFNIDGFVRNIENLYESMWQSRQSGNDLINK